MGRKALRQLQEAKARDLQSKKKSTPNKKDRNKKDVNDSVLSPQPTSLSSPQMGVLRSTWATDMLGSHLTDCSKVGVRFPTRELANAGVIGSCMSVRWCDPLRGCGRSVLW